MDKLAAMTTFVAVVETGSFTKAADLLALPKPRVSQRVSDLEHHLGVRLLQRTTRVLSLTEDGRAYFAKCQVILQDIHELEDALSGENTVPCGKLRVDSLASIARWILAPALHEFQARYPDIALRLDSSDRISQLLEEGIDCAIRGGHLENSSQIARHVCDITPGLYAAPAYLASAGAVGHPAELTQHRCLSWFTNQRNPGAWQLQCATESCEINLESAMQFDNSEVATIACIAGSGICPGAPFAVAHWVQSGALVPVLPHWHFSSRPIHILYPSNKHLSARVRCFVEWAFALMQATPSLRMSPQQLAEQHPVS